jgi:hypothetical protein
MAARSGLCPRVLALPSDGELPPDGSALERFSVADFPDP